MATMRLSKTPVATPVWILKYVHRAKHEVLQCGQPVKGVCGWL